MSVLPHILFRYSSAYDEQWRAAWEHDPADKKPSEYPSLEQIQKFLQRIEKEWRKTERRVFRSIEKTSGLSWTWKEHVCYVVGFSVPFSDPLTIPVFRKEAPIDYVVDVLAHELIHRNLIQPQYAKTVNKALAGLRKKFPHENENVIIHILVHAIHEKVFLDIFSEARLRREKKIMGAFDDYRRAWEIVTEQGAEKILEIFS